MIVPVDCSLTSCSKTLLCLGFFLHHLLLLNLFMYLHCLCTILCWSLSSVSVKEGTLCPLGHMSYVHP